MWFLPGLWTSSTPSAGSWRVHGSSPNQSTLFVDLEKVFDSVPWGLMWGVVREYGVPDSLIGAVRSLYDRFQSLVRIAGSKSNLFPMRVGLCQGCPLSSILFITYMDRISRRSQDVEGVRFGDLRIGSLLFADDLVLLASSARDLQLSLERFATEWARSTGKRPRRRPRTCWRDYVSQLAWERLGVPQEELVEVAEEREVWASLLRSLPP